MPGKFLENKSLKDLDEQSAKTIGEFLDLLVEFSKENQPEIAKETANEKIADEIILIAQTMKLLFDNLNNKYEKFEAEVPDSIKADQEIIAALSSDNLQEKYAMFLKLQENKLGPRLKSIFPNNDQVSAEIHNKLIKATKFCKIMNALLWTIKDFIRAVNRITNFINESYNLNLRLIPESYEVGMDKGSAVSLGISKFKLFKSEVNPPLGSSNESPTQLLGTTDKPFASLDDAQGIKTMKLSP